MIHTFHVPALIKLGITASFSFMAATIIAAGDKSVLLPLWVAIVVGGSGILGPLLLGYVQSRARHRDKLEDWAREDGRAKKVAEAARELANSNKVIADKLAETTEQTNGQLKQIHTLVNSNLTEAMRAELNSTVRELSSLNLIVEMNRERGTEPTVEALAVIDSTQKRISELKANLDDRLRQGLVVEQQQQQQQQQ